MSVANIRDGDGWALYPQVRTQSLALQSVDPSIPHITLSAQQFNILLGRIEAIEAYVQIHQQTYDIVAQVGGTPINVTLDNAKQFLGQLGSGPS